MSMPIPSGRAPTVRTWKSSIRQLKRPGETAHQKGIVVQTGPITYPRPMHSWWSGTLTATVGNVYVINELTIADPGYEYYVDVVAKAHVRDTGNIGGFSHSCWVAIDNDTTSPAAQDDSVICRAYLGATATTSGVSFGTFRTAGRSQISLTGSHLISFMMQVGSEGAFNIEQLNTMFDYVFDVMTFPAPTM